MPNQMNDDDKFARLKRPRQPMPDFVREAHLAHGLMAADVTYHFQNERCEWVKWNEF